MGSECEASDHLGGWAVDGDLTGKTSGTGHWRVTGQRGVRTRDGFKGKDLNPEGGTRIRNED